MKKIIISACLFLLTTSAFSLQLAIKATSFDTSATVEPGSAQWADIKFVAGPYTGSDRLQIYIQYKDASGFYNGPLVKCFDTAFYPFYFNLPENADTTRRVNFNLPATALCRAFKITVNLAPTTFYGIFNYTSITTGIRNNINRNQPVKEVQYFNFAGQPIAEPSGRCIRKTIYEDESFESKQIFIVK